MLDINKLNDATVFDKDGDKIGTVGSVYVKDETNQPSFVTVKTGLFGTKETFVPVDAATETAEGIQVPFTKAFVKDAPNVDADGHITEAEEDEIHRYYSAHRDERTGVATGAAAGAAGAGALGHDRDRVETDRAAVADTHRNEVAADAHREDDGSIVRREEELRVGKERVETGRVRLRKHVVTEQKTVTVPVEREEFEVVREPITDGHTGGQLSEDEASITLSEERPVVDKQVVDKERIGLNKNTVAEERQVSADVSREEVEVERDGQAGLQDKLDRN